jgi:hypothetical protein
MTFAQRRNRPTTHFSEGISVVKRRISVRRMWYFPYSFFPCFRFSLRVVLSSVISVFNFTFLYQLSIPFSSFFLGLYAFTLFVCFVSLVSSFVS